MKKTYFKLRAAIVAVLMVAVVSCSEDSPSVTEQKDLVLNQLLKSKEFNQLSIPLADLDLQNPVIQDGEKGRASIVVRFANDRFKYLLAFPTGSGRETRFTSIIIGEYHTKGTPEQLNEALRAGTFTGIFTMTSSVRQISVHVENGKFVKNEISRESAGGRAQSCGLVEAGRCAATRIDQMNWLDYAICVADIAICWPLMVASCFIDDCVASPQVPQP